MVLFGSVNEAMFDWPWSGIHLASGFLIGALLTLLMKKKNSKQFWVTGFGLLLVWELVEVTLRYLDLHAHDTIAPFKSSVAGFAFGPESIINIIGDMMIGTVGLRMGALFAGLFPRKH